MSDKLKGFNTNSTSNIKTFSSFNNSTSANSNTYIQNVATNNNRNVETLDLNNTSFVNLQKNALGNTNNTTIRPRNYLTNPISIMDYSKSGYNFYTYVESLGGEYGVDQGVFRRICSYELNGVKYTYDEATQMINEAIQKGEAIPVFLQVISAPQTYNKMIEKIMKLGYGKQDAELILNMIDYSGACSYASTCNEIFQQFSGNPELFKKVFGYDMYIPGKNGNQILNVPELLLDLYMFANDQKNGGKLLNNGKINSEYLTDEVDPLGNHTINVGDNQVYFSGTWGKNSDMINKFLKSKNSALNYEEKTSIEVLDYADSSGNSFHQTMFRRGNNNVSAGKNKNATNDKNLYKEYVEKGLSEGKSFTLDYFYQPEYEFRSKIIHMNSLESDVQSVDTTTWGEGGGHSVAITGVTDSGFIVSSWGVKYEIPLSDLEFQENAFLTESTITANDMKLSAVE